MNNAPLNHATFVTPDEIRARFARAMSDMYRQEVPQYAGLLDLVREVNAAALHEHAALREQLSSTGELERLEVERHGAIRLGTAQELATMRRIFQVMGMLPVGYYDLSVAGVPVHSTAFRPVDAAALARNPFRMFTSLLRLELIEDTALRSEVAALLGARTIFTAQALALTLQCEQAGGLTSAQADAFVAAVRETFRWHSEATVDEATYHRLHAAHRLIADVACFKGPHINHLTPRTLDIDRAQREMPRRGMAAKEVVEGPPARKCPILLRQTSFKALEERVAFVGGDATASATSAVPTASTQGTWGTQGTHTARFGEIEQRGMALTRKGRALYDGLLAQALHTAPAASGPASRPSSSYAQRLADAFRAFPDDEDAIRQQELAFFTYSLTDAGRHAAGQGLASADLQELVARKLARARPMVYEDFLPVSAAGIFQSNLGDAQRRHYAAHAAQAAFEAALGSPVHDEILLYEKAQAQSIDRVRAQLRGAVPTQRHVQTPVQADAA